MERLVFLDSAFEAVLGAALVVLVATGLLEGGDFGVAGAALIAAGVALLAFAGGLYALASGGGASKAVLLGLSLGNELAAFAIAIWAIAGDISGGGQALLWSAVAGLAVLSALQLRAALLDRSAPERRAALE